VENATGRACVLETPNRRRYRVGCDPVSKEGRVSDARIDFDAQTRLQDRRMPVLSPPDSARTQPEADHFLEHWCVLNKVDRTTLV
jgi:hypothetical protein